MELRTEIIRWDEDVEEIIISAEKIVNTPHIAGALIEEAVFPDDACLALALQQVFRVFIHLEIPIHLHIKPIHVHDISGHIEEDWALSDLAYYVLLLNAEKNSDASMIAQAFALSRLCK